MFCRYCSNVVPENASFCNSCGKPISVVFLNFKNNVDSVARGVVAGIAFITGCLSLAGGVLADTPLSGMMIFIGFTLILFGVLFNAANKDWNKSHI